MKINRPFAKEISAGLCYLGRLYIKAAGRPHTGGIQLSPSSSLHSLIKKPYAVEFMKLYFNLDRNGDEKKSLFIQTQKKADSRSFRENTALC